MGMKSNDVLEIGMGWDVEQGGGEQNKSLVCQVFERSQAVPINCTRSRLVASNEATTKKTFTSSQFFWFA